MKKNYKREKAKSSYNPGIKTQGISMVLMIIRISILQSCKKSTSSFLVVEHMHGDWRLETGDRWWMTGDLHHLVIIGNNFGNGKVETTRNTPWRNLHFSLFIWPNRGEIFNAPFFIWWSHGETSKGQLFNWRYFGETSKPPLFAWTCHGDISMPSLFVFLGLEVSPCSEKLQTTP